jgi:hypothetical protein
LLPSTFAHILVVGNTASGLQEAIDGGEKSFNLQDLNAAHGNLEDRDVRAVKGGAPFAEASKLPGHEIGLVTSTFKY